MNLLDASLRCDCLNLCAFNVKIMLTAQFTRLIECTKASSALLLLIWANHRCETSLSCGALGVCMRWFFSLGALHTL